MSHRGQRGMKPQTRDRRDRRAAFDLYLPRLESGALTPAEGALLAEYVREELRIADETRGNLVAASRALESIRNATDDAVREAESRAREAEEHLAVYRAIEDEHRADPRRGMMQRTVDHYRERAKNLEAENEQLSARLGEQEPRILAFDPPGLDGTVVKVPGPAPQPAAGVSTEQRANPAKGADEMRRRAIAEVLAIHPDTPWPMLVEHVREAHQWARRAKRSTKPRPLAEAEAELTRSENAREELRRRLAAAEERARVATAAALNLRSQPPNAAQSTLAMIRKARTWGAVWTHLGMYYGMKPEEAGLEARARRLEADRRAKERAERLAAAEHRAVRYRTAWRSACRRAARSESARKLIAARMEHTVSQSAGLSALLEDSQEDARRAHAALRQWGATYGEHALRDTLARLNAAESAVKRVCALRREARAVAPLAAGPTWEALWDALGEALDAPARHARAVRCEPDKVTPGHPVEALLSALTDARPREAGEAISLTRAYYEAIHSACCLLDHCEPRPGRAAEARRALAGGLLCSTAGTGAQR